MSAPLTPADRLTAFKQATSCFKAWFGKDGFQPMDDLELTAALEMAFSPYSGSCGPDRMHVTAMAAGLRIWASWDIHNPYQTQPIFQGRETLMMAREVYGVADPAERQMSLF